MNKSPTPNEAWPFVDCQSEQISKTQQLPPTDDVKIEVKKSMRSDIRIAAYIFAIGAALLVLEFSLGSGRTANNSPIVLVTASAAGLALMYLLFAYPSTKGRSPWWGLIIIFGGAKGGAFSVIACLVYLLIVIFPSKKKDKAIPRPDEQPRLPDQHL